MEKTIYWNEETKKYQVQFLAGESRNGDDSCDYMYVKIGDTELYAERITGWDGESPCDEDMFYDELKEDIITQAKEKGINPEDLQFWYDD